MLDAEVDALTREYHILLYHIITSHNVLFYHHAIQLTITYAYTIQFVRHSSKTVSNIFQPSKETTSKLRKQINILKSIKHP